MRVLSGSLDRRRSPGDPRAVDHASGWFVRSDGRAVFDRVFAVSPSVIFHIEPMRATPSGRPTDAGALVAALLVTPIGTEAVRGPELGAPSAVPNGAVAWRDGVITYVGPADALPADAPEPRVFAGATVVPGFVDAHTHLPFFGWRADEFEARLAGRSYRDLQGDGGGIPRSARMLAGAEDETVLAFCRPLVREMTRLGTTTFETKTGYGLSVEAELRQARLARRLAAEVDAATTLTLLVAHAVPEGARRDAWIRLAVDELIPRAVAEGLADAVDVYVEDIAFSLDDLEAVADAAARYGLALRVHADQLGGSGAAEAAVRLGARSADHLNHVSDGGVEALGGSSTTAVVLPSSTFSMAAPPAPARRLIEAGAAVAIATDFNPGTSAVLSMPETIAVACALYRLTPAEALTAATLNAAAVLGAAGRAGSLEPGKRADVVVLEGEGVAYVPYRPGHDPVVTVFVGGRELEGR
jgi:imidazolonepropionase